jgi:hypothetical protein
MKNSSTNCSVINASVSIGVQAPPSSNLGCAKYNPDALGNQPAARKATDLFNMMARGHAQWSRQVRSLRICAYAKNCVSRSPGFIFTCALYLPVNTPTEYLSEMQCSHLKCRLLSQIPVICRNQA